MSEYVKNIPKSMRDRHRHPDDDSDKFYACWKPIPSTVTDKELKELESLFGHPLPLAYRYFLQQWHFIKLYMNQNNFCFFSSLPSQLASKFKEILKKYYAGLPQRGFLPIANFSDWGVACFDARRPVPGNDYPVVVLDHEDGYTNSMTYAANFEEMFQRERGGWIWLGAPGWKRKDEIS